MAGAAIAIRIRDSDFFRLFGEPVTAPPSEAGPFWVMTELLITHQGST